MNCLYVPNSDWLKSRTSRTGVRKVMANAAIRPDISFIAGRKVDSSDDIFDFRNAFSGGDQARKNVWPPGKDESARHTEHDEGPHPKSQRHRIIAERSLLHLPCVIHDEADKQHERHKT